MAVVCERPGVYERYVSILHSESIVILKSREYARFDHCLTLTIQNRLNMFLEQGLSGRNCWYCFSGFSTRLARNGEIHAHRSKFDHCLTLTSPIDALDLPKQEYPMFRGSAALVGSIYPKHYPYSINSFNHV